MLPPWAQRISDLLAADPQKTASGLARACGIKPGSVSGWFGGGKPTKMISGDNLISAAEYLGTTPEYIMTGRNPSQLSQSQPAELDLEMLKSAIVSVKEALRDIGLELEAFIAAPMIAYAYAERIKLPRTMTKTEYRAFDRMVTERLRGELGDVAEGRSVAETGSRGIEEASSNQAKDGHRRRAG
jgi:hypothetical protein